MDFFKLIQSLDELIYEVVSLLLFYPLTLWRMIRAPLSTMKFAEAELEESDRKQFVRMVPPPMFLLVTLILMHSVELGTVGESRLVLSNSGFSALISDDTSYIIFRILTFSILPLAAAVRLVRARGQTLDKEALRAPFYAQCYAASVFALLTSVAQIVVQQPGYILEAYAGLMVAALLWLLTVETRWFASELKSGLLRGFGQALLMFIQWLAVMAAIAIMLS